MLKFFIENKIIILLFIIAIVIYIIAINRGLELLYVIAELSLATLVLSLIAPYFNILGIRASVKHPKYSKQTQNIPILIEISASNFFGKYFLEVWLKTPFSTNMNHMFFIKSLYKKLTIESEVSSDIRGVHQIGPLHIQTGFPLGLKVFNKILENTKSEIVVLPNPLQVEKFPLSQDESFALYGDNKSKKKGGHDEFVSVREYKRGDSPRYIHWPSSAKKGKLIVREYQDILASSLIIILDLNRDFNVGLSKESTLEYAITIASSLAIYGLDKGYSVSIYGRSKDEIKLIDIKGSYNNTEILKNLAYVESDGDKNYVDSIKHFLCLDKRGGTLILFDNGSGEVERNMNSYISSVSNLVLFDIDAQSFKNDVFNEEFEIHNYTKYNKYILKKGCDLKRMLS
ncbi:DUF58 domain-containing protein [Sulfurospirillum arcachonense]|uniref:DUF58 domain-containing protein n=1 Tax=Sulfurospirillum arcachonense TaxID=57666 RepID=UPI00046ABDC4|nr:DUF58 domain-containing protein [Sulfurospirillum arcachonense]